MHSAQCRGTQAISNLYSDQVRGWSEFVLWVRRPHFDMRTFKQKVKDFGKLESPHRTVGTVAVIFLYSTSSPSQPRQNVLVCNRDTTEH